MRRDVVIAVAGAAAILLAGAGLVTGALREGPLAGELRPVVLPVEVDGTYHATGPSDLNGVCLQPPCDARTTVDLTFVGLPDGAYDAYLSGPGARSAIGSVQVRDHEGVLRFAGAADHTDKERITLMWGGSEVLALAVRATAEPLGIDTRVDAGIDTPAGTYRADEIGGVSVSTVVDVRLPLEPPSEGRYHAWFDGRGGWVDLGPLASDAGAAHLDARVERLRLEDQDRLAVYLEPTPGQGAAPRGFPVLAADL